MTATFIAEAIMMTILVFTFMTVLAMLFRYVTTLHKRIQAYNVENIKLLDGMHEGLLILSKQNHSVMFCNKPSQKFLKAALSAVDINELQSVSSDEQTRLLKEKMFTPILVSVRNKDTKFKQTLSVQSPNQQTMICLDQIITTQADEPN